MSVSEQELFGLMVAAQEQQKVAAAAVEQIEAQRVALERTIEQARAVVQQIEAAGASAGGVIEKAARQAVASAAEGALLVVTDEAKKAVKPFVSALAGATAGATEAEQRLHATATGFTWRWGVILASTAAMLLGVVLGVSLLLVPSPEKIAALRAEVSYLESKGAAGKFTNCGPEKRLCVEIDTKGEGYGERGQFRILKGY